MISTLTLTLIQQLETESKLPLTEKNAGWSYITSTSKLSPTLRTALSTSLSSRRWSAVLTVACQYSARRQIHTTPDNSVEVLLGVLDFV
jgi:hypothetical protein